MLWDFVDQGNSEVDFMPAHLLAKSGDVDTLPERAAEGHVDAAQEAARILRDRGDVDQAVAVLTSHADAGSHLGEDLAELLRVTGRVEDLRARAASGDTYAVVELTRLAIEEDDLDEAVRLHALKGRTAGLLHTTRSS